MSDKSGTQDATSQLDDPDDEGDSEAERKRTISKCLVWLSPEQRVPESQITDDDVSKLTVVCSACGQQINHHKTHKVHVHKDLNVIVCKKCFEYYGDGNFDKDDTGSDEYCTWCAEGGKLLVCDKCSRAFCKDCIRRNLTRREISRIMALDLWHCYVCDPKQVAELVRYAEIIRSYSMRAKPQRHASLPEVLDISVGDEDNVEETLSGIAQQLHLMADMVKSNSKNAPKTALQRVSSMLKCQFKNVSKLAKKVESRQKKNTKTSSQEESQTLHEHGKRKASSPIAEHDQGNHETGSDVDSTVGVSASGNKTSKHKRQKCLLPLGLENSSWFLQSSKQDEERNPSEEEKESKKGNASDESEEDEKGMDAVPNKKRTGNVKMEDQTVSETLMRNTVTNDEGMSSVKDSQVDSDRTQVDDGDIVLSKPEKEEATADPAGFGTEEFVLNLDGLNPLISESQDESETGTVIPDSQELFAGDESLDIDSKIDSPSLLRELRDSQESGNAPAPLKMDDGMTFEEKSRNASAQAEDCKSGKSEAKKCTEGRKRSTEAEDSSSLSGNNVGGDHVAEAESLESNSESDSPTSEKGAPPKRPRRKRAPLSENEKARRALQRSLRKISSDSSSNDDAHSPTLKSSPRICKTTPTKRGRRPPYLESTPRATKAKKSSDQELVTQDNSKDDNGSAKYSANDPKLKMEPVVIVNMLNLGLSAIQGQATNKMKNSEHSDSEIANLLKMPGKVKTKSKDPADTESDNEKKKPAAVKKVEKKRSELQAVLDSSEESGSEGSSADDISLDGQKPNHLNRKAAPKSNNELSKEALLQSLLESSSESVSEDEDPVPATKKAPKKMKKDVQEDCTENDKGTRGASDDSIHDNSDEDDGSDDEDEEIIKKKNKKLKKYEKLLKKTAAISVVESSDDGDVKKKNANEAQSRTKKASPKKRKLKFSDEEDSAAGSAKKAASHQESSDDSSAFSSSSDSLVDFETPKKKKTAQKCRTRRGEKKTSSESESAKPRRKRRRIKVAASSSGKEDEDDDVEIISVSQNSDTKGRKNIRKLLTDGELTKQTKAAAQAEEERKKRIRERQKLYNDVMGKAAYNADTEVEELILEMDTETKMPIVSVNPLLVRCMKPHQTKGVKFMYDCTIETVEMLAKDKKGAGAILAHCMGLGKTFQVISFLHTILTNKRTMKYISTALVVCPYNTILNWVDEFERWLEDKDLEVPVREISSIKDITTRVEVLELWHEVGGVLILGYDMFRLLVNGKGRRFPVRLRDRIEKALLNPGPDIVVCDEGHVLKNDSSNLSKAMVRLRTNRRIVLTGTPLQNNLQEYHCMVNFVKPNLLGTKKEFLNRFINPIKNGQCADSTLTDVKLMKKRVHILHSLLDGCVQRCDYSSLAPFLPPKHEYVISVKLSDQQVALYRHYLDNFARNKSRGSLGAGMLCDYNALRTIWTHPYLLQLCAERAALKEVYEEDDDDDFINDESESEGEANGKDKDVICLDDPQPSSSKKNEKKSDDESSGDEIVKSWHTRSRGAVSEDTEAQELKEERERREKEKQWWSHYVPEEDMERYEISGKMLLLCHILQECEAIGDKVLLFSQSLMTLNMVEQMLRQFEERAEAAAADPTAVVSVNDALRDCQNTWTLGVDYFRMDGSTAADVRKRWIEIFNCDDNPRARLFLISTRAGSLGTNLVGANRVILMDASWNPTHDVQSIFRVYRFGQKKPVFIYRLLAQGTMEEKIYDRQVTKQSLSCRVVDEQQIERHFNAADLQELYRFDPESKSNRPTPMVPKDRLLAELLIRHKEWIVSYHEHDSLLQNITEEDLTEEERKTAWEEYNAEREGRFKMNMENTNMYQGAQQNSAGTPNTLTIDLNKIVNEIRQQNPNMSSSQLAVCLKNALSAYRQQFRNQQIQAFNQRQEYLKAKQQVPQDLADRLHQCGVAIQQLNNLMAQLDHSVNSARAGTATHSTGMPNVNAAYQQYQQRLRTAQQFAARMQQAAMFQAQMRFRQPYNAAFRPSTTAPIVCEADDGTPNEQRPAQRPSTSSVTITEIID